MRLRTSEKRGLLLLCIILSGFFILPSLFKNKHNPFILIAKEELPDNNNTKKQRSKSHTPIELNTVDSITLVKIRGIGPYYASKILKYRKRLGGFYSPSQLKDIHFKYLKIDSLLTLFHANPNYIQKQDLDTMSFKTVLKHPYLEYEDVQLIFNAKRKWKQINYSILAEKKVLAPHKLKKIKAYFK